MRDGGRFVVTGTSERLAAFGRGALASLLLAAGAPAQGGAIWHVDDDARRGGDGTSWRRAFDTLQGALDVAGVGDQVWVATGRYVPTLESEPGDPRSRTFSIPIGARVFGGFKGHELTLDERAGAFDRTVLSGDLGVPGDPSDNSLHVVRIYNPSGLPPGGTWLDGFVVRDGNADGSLAFRGEGGGILAYNAGTRLRNLTVVDNRAKTGGGLHGQLGSLRIIDCRFEGNKASLDGGALGARYLYLRTFHSVFVGNAAGDAGGAVWVGSTTLPADAALFAGCVFLGNAADRGGAVFLNGHSSSAAFPTNSTWSMCTFVDNAAASLGGGLLTQSGAAFPPETFVSNSIVHGNRAPAWPQIRGTMDVCHSLVQSGYPGIGNLDAAPGFVDQARGDLRLAPGSPCIDAGDEGRVTRDELDLDGDGQADEPLPVDLDGRRRFVDDPATPNTGAGPRPFVDLGAFEHQPGG